MNERIFLIDLNGYHNANSRELAYFIVIDISTAIEIDGALLGTA